MNYFENDFDWAKQYVSEDEKILWQGAPVRNRLIEKHDAFLIPFSIVWLAFAVFWEASVIIAGAPLSFPLFGAIFVPAGLYFVFGRFIYKSYINKRTSYVITNKKILRKRAKKIDMLYGNNLPQMEISANSDGTGTISFISPIDFSYYRRNSLMTTGERYSFTLRDVEKVGAVADIIQSIVPSVRQ